MTTKDLLDLKQYSPKEWGAKIDYDSWQPTTPTNQLFIHWGGPPVSDTANDGNINGEKATLRKYENFHVNTKGWKGLAYDWAIGQSGTLYRVRGLARSAAQAGDADQDRVDNNLEGEGILCIIGEGQTPSKEMLATLKRVIEVAKPKDLYGHKEGRGTKTACPGPELMDFISNIRAGAPQPAPARRPSKPAKSPAPASSGGSKTTLEKIVSDLGTIKRGERSDAVKRAQALLNLTGMFSLRIDGVFGSQTELAVEEYQGHKRLSKDGIVGPKTWTSLLTARL